MGLSAEAHEQQYATVNRAPGPSGTRGLQNKGAIMNRKTFDYLLSAAGLIVAIVLLAVGGLLLWGHVFVDHQVHNQLAAQRIFFPPKGSPAIAGPQFAAMRQYAGQQLVTGPQAQTYADHFIAVHLSEVAGGKTYAQVSSEALANPGNAALKAEADTLFRGTTLRGLLLNAFAFSEVARIAGIAAIVCFVGAGVLLVLAAFGFVHARSSGRAVEAPTAVEERLDKKAA